VYPFTGAPLTPAEAAHVRDAVTRERRTGEPFDLCVWGFADQAAAYEAAGVTWLIQAAGPEDALTEASRIISAGAPR
jgi:hypothetical protein